MSISEAYQPGADLVVAMSDQPDAYRVRITPEGARLAERVLTLSNGPLRSVRQLPQGGYVVSSPWGAYQYDGSGRMTCALENFLLSDVHFADLLPDGRALITATGADAVLLMDWCGRVDWGWWADEDGFGSRGLPHDHNWRERGLESAQHHLAHPNCARWSEGGALITLLGPHGVVEGSGWRDGSVLLAAPDQAARHFLTGLAAPHGCRPTQRGYLCVESLNCRVVEADPDGKMLWEYVSPDLLWSKTALPVWVGAERLYVMGITETHSLRAVDAAGETRWELLLPGEPYSLEPLSLHCY